MVLCIRVPLIGVRSRLEPRGFPLGYINLTEFNDCGEQTVWLCRLLSCRGCPVAPLLCPTHPWLPVLRGLAPGSVRPRGPQLSGLGRSLWVRWQQGGPGAPLVTPSLAAPGLASAAGWPSRLAACAEHGAAVAAGARPWSSCSARQPRARWAAHGQSLRRAARKMGQPASWQPCGVGEGRE